MSLWNTSRHDIITVGECSKPRLFEGHFSSFRRSRLTRVRGRRPGATGGLAHVAAVLLTYVADGQRVRQDMTGFVVPWRRAG